MKLLLENWRKFVSEGYIIDDPKYNAPIRELFRVLEAYNNNTWIFFDTETTGFNPLNDQLTEIGAIVAEPNGWNFSEVQAEEAMFYDKFKLNPETLEKFRTSDDPNVKYPLKLTRYGMPSGEYKKRYPKGMPTEEEALREFISFLQSQQNPVLVAHNAPFDIGFIQGRADYYNIPVNMQDYPIFDSLMLVKLWHNPLIKTLAAQGDERAQTVLDALSMDGKFGKYTSASMGAISRAYVIDTDDWHNALADVKMMMSMLKTLFVVLEEWVDTDISKLQGRAAWGVRKRNKGK